MISVCSGIKFLNKYKWDKSKNAIEYLETFKEYLF